MAKYKNREVTVIKELPRPDGDQVEIEHKDLNLGKEIVLKKDVILSQEEMGQVLKAREVANAPNDFKIQSEVTPTGEHTIKAQTSQEKVQK